MSMVYVVLGMHRSGTSLVSSMLHRAGVPMCRYRCSKGDTTQPYGYYEDHDFVVLNRAILAGARGNWHNPPSRKAIDISANELYPEMVALVESRAEDRTAWGWKDPRTTLTALSWHKTLMRCGHTPRYVLAVRDETAVIQSLLRRNGGKEVEWAKLYNQYNKWARRFLSRLDAGAYMVIQFNELIRGDSERVTGRLAEFAEVPDEVSTMLKQIHRREA